MWNGSESSGKSSPVYKITLIYAKLKFYWFSCIDVPDDNFFGKMAYKYVFVLITSLVIYTAAWILMAQKVNTLMWIK